jgi:hypothetical protein
VRRLNKKRESDDVFGRKVRRARMNLAVLGCLFHSGGLDVRAHKIDRARPSPRRLSATTQASPFYWPHSTAAYRRLPLRLIDDDPLAYSQEEMVQRPPKRTSLFFQPVSSVRQGAPVPPSLPTSGIAVSRAACQRRQRHRSHAQTIRAVARIVEHGEEPPFDRRAREGLLW